MAKEIIVNADLAEEVRIAIIENGKLMDLDIEAQSRTKHKGNIYKGIVSNIEDSLDAAFIDIGEEKQAFLPRSEIRPGLYPESLKGQKRVKISDVLSRGQEIVVQVTKDEIGTKGAAVSTYLSLPGRYVVLMHSDESGGGISRKIENENARRAARDMLARLSVPEGMAVIIRTAGMNATRQDLLRDFKNLCDAWQQIDKGCQLGRAPTLIYREPDIVVRTIRDYFTGDVSRVVIDDEEEYDEALSYFKVHMPDLEKILEKHRKKEPIFQSYGIEEAIEDLFQRQVKLPSGGYIVIEQTEALVSVDVNSGGSNKEEDHEATVYKTNLEAADELARQLRLRDLGGIVVVDFIDMASRRHKRDVEKRLCNAMSNDKARVKVGRIGDNGTLELTRQRLRQSHHLISHVSCRHCEGTGRVRDAQGLALLVLRRIHGHLSKKRTMLAKLSIRLPVEVANVLNNQKRRELLDIGESYELDLEIIGDPNVTMSTIALEEERRGQAGLDAASHGRESKWAEQKNSKRGKNSHQDKWTPPQKPATPLSIGPAPALIDFDEEDPGQEAATLSQTAPLHAPVPSKTPEPEHFDDPLMEALFGVAPKMQLPNFAVREDRASSEDQEEGDDQIGPRDEQEVEAEQLELDVGPKEVQLVEMHDGDTRFNRSPSLEEEHIDDDIGNSTDKMPASASARPRKRGFRKRFHKRRDKGQEPAGEAAAKAPTRTQEEG